MYDTTELGDLIDSAGADLGKALAAIARYRDVQDPKWNAGPESASLEVMEELIAEELDRLRLLYHAVMKTAT